jgi:hypothetical protein
MTSEEDHMTDKAAEMSLAIRDAIGWKDDGFRFAPHVVLEALLTALYHVLSCVPREAQGNISRAIIAGLKIQFLDEIPEDFRSFGETGRGPRERGTETWPREG